MQLAILHHHLNRGGVTSVIANHLRALATLPDEQRPERVVVLFDGQRDGWPDTLVEELADRLPVELAIAPSLAYDATDEKADPAALAAKLLAHLAGCGLAAESTLLHTHNHSLGKNASLPGALARLANAGWRMLLQVHDFAEDNRPENYRHLQQALGENNPDRLGAVLYPQGPGVHYATLTERDAEVLRVAGFSKKRLHTLPNPIAGFDSLPSKEAAKARVFPLLGLTPEARLIVYPVRGIRRKNLGEMLLLAALAPAGTHFAVTLRPKNPVEALSFDRWRSVAEECGLPCFFDTGSPVETGGYGCDFHDTLAAADAVLTTSVAEGFGMVFLEAWLAGKPLVGRDLPEITREFKAAGMRFDAMWEELRASTHLDDDFGRLTAKEQIAAVRAARRPDVPLDLGIERSAAHIETNARIVRRQYSTEHLGRKIGQALGAVASSRDEADGSPCPGEIARHFQNPSQQSPIRSEVVSAEPESTLLIDRIAALSRPLEPLPTDETPALPRLPGVRAVVFDVYGTLLVSGSGDISLASEEARGEAVTEALLGLPAKGFSTDLSGIDGDAIVAALHAQIHAAHEASDSDHPEVEIRDVWRETLAGCGFRYRDDVVDRLAIEYECRVNPIWPMPGLAETLNRLAASGIALGIVSNAQFFTPLAFEPLTGKSLDRWGFDPRLCVWSYEHREAKPGTFLYERCAAALEEREIEPRETLFVGNDLRNDVWPAQRVGFKTALFAGDARSLRWREDDDRLSGVRPDAVVTDLRQLLDVVLLLPE